MYANVSVHHKDTCINPWECENALMWLQKRLSSRIDLMARKHYNGPKRWHWGVILMSQSQEKMLTVKQVADRMSVDERTVRGWIQKGELKAVNIGGRLRREYRI